MKQILLVGLIVTLLLVGVAVAQDYPVLNGYVTDNAGILTPNERTTLESRIAQINKDTSVEIAILDVQTTNGESLYQYASKVGNQNGVGNKTTDNGVVILVSFDNERGIFIAPGKGAEGVITDSEAKRIYESGKPYFSNKQYAAGYNVMLDGIEAELAKDDSVQTEAVATPAPAATNSDGSLGFMFIVVMVVLCVIAGALLLATNRDGDSEPVPTTHTPFNSSSERRRRGHDDDDDSTAALAAILAASALSGGHHHDDDDVNHHSSESGYHSHFGGGGSGGFGGFGGGSFGGGGAGGRF